MDRKRQKKKKVCFQVQRKIPSIQGICLKSEHVLQTSVDPSVEESALKTFVVFEKGDSGDLTFNQFQQVLINVPHIRASLRFSSFSSCS